MGVREVLVAHCLVQVLEVLIAILSCLQPPVQDQSDDIDQSLQLPQAQAQAQAPGQAAGLEEWEWTQPDVIQEKFPALFHVFELTYKLLTLCFLQNEVSSALSLPSAHCPLIGLLCDPKH